MHCAVAACPSTDDAYTVWRGFALCKSCYEYALEIPSTVPDALVDQVIALAIDAKYVELFGLVAGMRRSVAEIIYDAAPTT